PLVFAHGNLVLLQEAKDLRVKLQSLVLVVHHDARQLDPHARLPAGSSVACNKPAQGCFSEIAKAAPINERHPGVSAPNSRCGGATIARARRRYADGGAPTRLAKRSLKVPRLVKPTSRQTSVTDRPRAASRTFARSSRASMRN